MSLVCLHETRKKCNLVKREECEPKLVVGEVLKPHVAADARRKVIGSAIYLAWPVDDSDLVSLRVRFTSSFNGKRHAGELNISRVTYNSWMPAVGLVECHESPASLSKAALSGECAHQVRDEAAAGPAGLNEVSALLSGHLEAPVRVSMTSQIGVVAVEFRDLMDLERIYWIMMSGQDQ